MRHNYITGSEVSWTSRWRWHRRGKE